MGEKGRGKSNNIKKQKRSKVEKYMVMMMYMLSPIKILKRARDAYMKGVRDCAGGVGYGGVDSYSYFQVSQLPLNRSNQYFKPCMIKKNGHGDNGDEDHEDEQQARVQKVGHKYNYNYRIMRKSHSVVGLRKMERIDEDQPCYFQEHHIDFNTPMLLSSRSRSNINVGSK